MTTDIELRKYALDIASRSSLHTKDCIEDEAEGIYRWLKQSQQPTPNPTFPQPVISDGDYTILADGGRLTIIKDSEHGQVGRSLDDLWRDLHQPAPEDRRGRGVAQSPIEWAAFATCVHNPQGRTDHLENLMALSKRNGLCETWAKNKAERDAIYAALGRDGYMVESDIAAAINGDDAAIDRLALRGIHVFKEAKAAVKTALAEAASQVAPATPQEDLEARRAYEASQPLKARLTVPASEWERLKGLGEQPYAFAINSGPVNFGDLPVITFEATLTKIEAPQAPAEQPATKRVPKVGDVILHNSRDYLVIAVGDGFFHAVEAVFLPKGWVSFAFSQEGLGPDDCGWSFKD